MDETVVVPLSMKESVAFIGAAEPRALTPALADGEGATETVGSACAVEGCGLELVAAAPTDTVSVANGLGPELPWEKDKSAPGDASATADEPPGRTTRREDATAWSLLTSAGAHSSATPAAAASKSLVKRGAIVDGAASWRSLTRARGWGKEASQEMA